MIVVIRAGGTGSRLWPVSRKSNPKQFASLIGDVSLISQTFQRVLPLVSGPEDIYVSVNEEHARRVLDQTPGLHRENVIVELSSRNTGPAICLETAFLRKRGISDETVVATIPSDDFITEGDVWREMMRASERFLTGHPEMIVTPGAKPDYLDTGYSFISVGEPIEQDGDIKFANIASWEEKPEEERARELLEKEGVFYHMGMYVWTLGNVHRRLSKACGHVLRECQAVLDSDDISKNRERYSSIPKESIETLLTKDCPQLVIVTAPSIGWSDVGKWHVVKHVLQHEADQNVVQGHVYIKDTNNSLIYAPEGKMVAVVGLDDVVVVDTGDALLVSRSDKSADVKKIVEQLEDEGKHQFL